MHEIQMLMLTPNISYNLTCHDISGSNKFFPVLYKYFSVFTKQSRNRNIRIAHNQSCILSNDIIMDMERKGTVAATEKFTEGKYVDRGCSLELKIFKRNALFGPTVAFTPDHCCW